MVTNDRKSPPPGPKELFSTALKGPGVAGTFLPPGPLALVLNNRGKAPEITTRALGPGLNTKAPRALVLTRKNFL